MPSQVAVKTIGSTFGRRIFGVFGFLFKIKIASLFIGFLLLNAAIISVQAKDVTPGIEDLGKRFLTPSLKLQEISLEVIEKEGFYVKESPNLYKNLWYMIISYGQFFTMLWILLIWLNVLAWLFSVSLFSDRSRVFVNYFGAVVLFFLIQWFYILIFSPEGISLMDPLLAFKDIGRAVPYIIQPLAKIADKWFTFKLYSSLLM